MNEEPRRIKETVFSIYPQKGKRTFTSVPGPTQRAGNPRFPCRQRHLETLRWSVAQLPIRSPRVVAAAERDPEDSDGPPGSGKVLAVSLKAQPPEGEGKAEGGEPGGLGPHTKSPRTEEPPSPKQKPTALQRQPRAAQRERRRSKGKPETWAPPCARPCRCSAGRHAEADREARPRACREPQLHGGEHFKLDKDPHNNTERG